MIFHPESIPTKINISKSKIYRYIKIKGITTDINSKDSVYGLAEEKRKLGYYIRTIQGLYPTSKGDR